jgi:ketosteroid isomerase-like protein
MDIKEFAEKYVQACKDAFQKGDFEALTKLEDPNVVCHIGAMPDMVGHEAHKQDIIGRRQSGSDIKQEWKYVTGEGNLFVLAYKAGGRITGGIPGLPTTAIGKKFVGDYLFVYRVFNGRVIEVWAKGTVTISD